MCFNPIQIYNKGYRPYDLRTANLINVDCGKCPQCQLQRSNGYAFRIQSEAFQPDTISFFVTLTYNDTYLPILYYKSYEKYNFDVKSVSTWNRLHIKRYNKRLRRKLHYYYGISRDSFKYLCCCERGSSDPYVSDSGILRIATSRPHYHLLYILYSSSDLRPVRNLPKNFFSYVRERGFDISFRSFFNYLLSSEWYYGRVKDIYKVRSEAQCTRYIAKYIVKNYGEQLFNIPLEDYVYLKDYEYEERKRLWKEKYSRLMNDGYTVPVSKFPQPIRNVDLQPRSFCSINLGMSFIYGLSLDEIKDYLLGIKKLTLVGSRRNSIVNLPFYYFKKLCKYFLFLKDGQKYTFSDGKKIRNAYAEPRFRSTREWNTQDGVINIPSVSYTSKSYYTELGEWFKSRNFQRKVDDSFTTLFLLRSCSDFFYSVSDVLKSTDYFKSFGGWYLNSCQIKFSLMSVFQRSESYIKYSLKRLFHRPYYYSLSAFEKNMFNLLNFYRLCKMYINEKKHLAYKQMYEQHLLFAVADNPDLFTNHYL